jgi:hypothetical protein
MCGQTNDSILGRLRSAHEEHYAEEEWFHKHQKELKRSNRPIQAMSLNVSSTSDSLDQLQFLIQLSRVWPLDTDHGISKPQSRISCRNA